MDPKFMDLRLGFLNSHDYMYEITPALMVFLKYVGW